VLLLKKYGAKMAHMIAFIIAYFNEKLVRMNNNEAFSFIQTYSFKKGLRGSLEMTNKSRNKELKQLNSWMVFEPI
jgi:hypothetical protein